MKTYIKFIAIVLIGISAIACQDLTELNVDPNKAATVSTEALLTGSQKKMMDYVYDNWFSGRQALPYAQYWCQNKYTEEDRYQIRESVNNNYFNYFYTVAGNYNNIELMNTDPVTKVAAEIYGDNNNQIAVAKILKVWLMQIMADTWGSIPYSEAFKLKEGVNYPKYDDLTELYPALITELNTAIALINPDKIAFKSGDVIYNGDAAKWKMFANSLKCRFAIRLSKVDSNWKTYISQAIASGVFTSNADEAMFKYINTAPNECYFYRGFITDARNDFSITKPFTDLLKGQRDTLNNKQHPWEGVIDPRLAIYTSSKAGKYLGLPYGLTSAQMDAPIFAASPNWVTAPPVTLNKDFSVPLMTYAELCFIMSEYNNFDKTWYENGIRASLVHWSDLNKAPLSEATITAYISSVNSVVNAETVATQKYIHLYMQGTEGWSEYRRTGYPNTLLKPGENSYFKAAVPATETKEAIPATTFKFTVISDTKSDLPARVKYPTNESTLNPAGFKSAVAKLTDATNNYYSKLYWDVRTVAVPHPANK